MDLSQLLEDGVIDEVLSRLKSGKEADVWLVRHHEEVLCAKVYKDRNFRSFKNNAGYKEGRAVRNTRTQRAIDRGSKFGQEAAEEAWKSAESDALHRLHAEGVRVPAPVIFYEGILLMKLVLDAEGHPAQRLIEAQLEAAQASALYADLRSQAVKMLCCDLIHGDLSPYNVLLGAAGPTIIDFPQVVSAAQNSTAESFFKRDLENLRKYFGGFEPALLARTESDSMEIWRAYVRRDLTPDFVPSGRPLPVAQERKPQPARQHGPKPGQHQRPQGQKPHGQHQRPGQPRQGQAQGQHHPRPQGPRPEQRPHAQGPRPQQEARPQQPSQPGQRPEQRPHGHNPQQHRPAPQRQGPPGQQQHRAGPPRHERSPGAPPQARPPPRHQRREVPQERLPPQLARPQQLSRKSPSAPPPRTHEQPDQQQPVDPAKRPG